MTESNWPENSACCAELLQRWSNIVCQATNLADMTSALCTLVQETVDVEAVAVRLRREDEFPMVELRGFSPEFVAVESLICRRDGSGTTIRDDCGNPTWDCLCGDVLGNRSVAIPCFTEYGSYWTNAAENMADDAAAVKGVGAVRTACLSAGYRSLALIPLRAGGRVVGLLQCHDRRSGRFTPASVAALENLAAMAAYAFGFLELSETLQSEAPHRASRDKQRGGRDPTTTSPRHVGQEVSPPRLGDFHWSKGRLGRARRLASVGTLASGIAHEINNPLAAIALYASVALRSMDDPDRRTMVEDAVRNIEAQALRCGRIVKSVLQFSQHERLQRWPIDLRPIAHRACELVQDLARRQKVLVVLARGDGPAKLTANPTEIEQVLVHLLTNAIEASSADGRVRLRVDPQHDGLRLMVEDQGHGMTREQVERMFDPFYTTRQREGAVGMGLSIVYGIVQSQGGAIDVQSLPGKGTTISIHLPQDLPTKGKSFQ